ncbi:major paralogous domain-containing protein [Fibrobacter sp. UWCM]|uniref:FISUMP domain-containing protein n=1 Tax=Fibrobacter sp. UWCM TaxID=1896208 RepID=UPI00091E6388|nr:FISUMP domain-containing protein [Fibrobacter sp. UWCM]SHH50406.1 major paralogous domain-containing protein [Fibrobacter sp. UWCM]
MIHFGRTFFAALVYATLFALLGACGDSGTDKELDSPYTEKRTLSGFVQKGPFSKGSKISIQELDAVTLLPVGEKIEGTVLNDEGTYSLEFSEFESPYALLTAVGTYRDELTGEKTKATVTLNALVDLTARKSANVNLLTHLEYLRVLYLVREEGLTVAEAKMQAEREVLRAFGISGDFALAEDLNIYSNGDGNAALLAISVIMLGGLEKDGGSGLPFGLATKNDDGEENSKLAERITDFAEDLEKDGLWKNGRTAANMADWAVEQGLNGKFDSFRTQVVSYIESFWWKIYGFDACDSTLDGAAWLNDNPYSANRGVYFICKNGKWIPERRGDDSKDTTDVKDSTQVRDTTDVADTTAVNDTTSIADTNSVADTTFVDTLSDFEKDIGGQRCTYFGRIIHGVVDTNNAYFCDGVKWKLFDGDENAQYYKLVDSRDGRIYRYVRIDIQYWMAENLNYGDTAYSWNEAKTACPAGWHLPSKEEWDYLFRSIGSTSQSELDKRGFAARPAGLLGVSYWTSSYDKDSQGRYPYDIFFSNTGTGLSKLHDSTSRFPVRCVQDYETLSACDEENLHRVARYNNMVYYVCEEDGWHMMNYDEYNEFKWTGAEEGKTLWDGSDPRICYVFDNGAWYERDSSNCKLGLGGCTAARQGELSKSSKSVWYTCDNGTWVGTMDSTVDQIMLGTDYDEGTVVKCPSNGRYCVFQDGHWREGTKMDSILYSLGGTPCMVEGDTSKVKYEGEYYVCRYVSWRAVHMQWETAPLIYNDTYEDRDECSATGLYGDGSFHNKHDNATGRIYVCEDGGFRLPTEREMRLNLGCTSYIYGKKITVNNTHFVCSEDGWKIDSTAWEYGSFMDTRDGRVYKTIDIWGQTWMAENLDYRDSVAKPELEGNRWCYGNEAEQCDAYGSFYSCELSSQVCPAGWHLPSISDWFELYNFIVLMGGDPQSGLRAKDGWLDYSDNVNNGTDVLGFTALPGGIMYGENSYGSATQEAWFWYAQDCSLNEYEAFYLSSEEVNFVTSSVSGGKITDAYSIRCIKD